MPLAGTIAADFSAFVAEAKKAETGLAQIDAEARKAEDAVAAVGSPSTVANLGTMGASASNSARGISALSDGLKTADKSFNLFGVSVSKEIATLDELGSLAGKTVAQVGALGTAFSVLGAATAGWAIGRKIAELIGSDKIIGDATAALMGWTDAAALGGNNAAVLQRAFQLTGKTFTDVHAASEAIRQSVTATSAQFTTSATLVAGWEKELRNARGGVSALKAEIEAGNLTLEQMRARFVVSGDAIAYLKRQMAEAEAATRKQAEADKVAAAEAKAHADARQKLRDQMFGTDMVAKAQEAIAAIGGIAGVTRMATEQQTALNTTIGLAIESLARAGKVGSAAMNEIFIKTLPLPPIVAGLGTEWNSVGEKVTANANKIIADLKRMTDETKAYEAETQRMADEWNKPTAKVEETTAAVGRLSVQMQDLGRVNQSVLESIVSGMQLMDAYRAAGVATGSQIALGGYNFQRQLEVGTLPTSAAAGASTLNVNVNNADAQGIADRLVTEMRHSGFRF